MSTTTETIPAGQVSRAAQVLIPGEQRVRIRGVPWETYQKITEAIGDQPIRIAYNQGDLELMSPGPWHERLKSLLSRIIELVALELAIPYTSLGSMTWEQSRSWRGLEADACYYWTPEKIAVARHRSRNPADYPAPDLAVEIDLSDSQVDRPAVYAALGVPEVWRFDGVSLRIDRLRDDGTYEPCQESRFLPVRPDEVVRWVLDDGAHDEAAWGRRLLDWVRAELGPRFRPGRA